MPLTSYLPRTTEKYLAMAYKPIYHHPNYDTFPATSEWFQTHVIAKEILEPIQEKSVMYLKSPEAST